LLENGKNRAKKQMLNVLEFAFCFFNAKCKHCIFTFSQFEQANYISDIVTGVFIMKVLNIFLSILILLLAVATAVFSFFLYEKRAQLIDGWEKMAQTVNKSAVSLDQGSGTEVAKALTVEELKHNKYEDLDQKLPKLPEHASNVVTERDNMAKALRSIAETVEMDNVKPLADFQALKSYQTNTSAVVSKVQDVTERQNEILQKICDSARKVSVDLTVSALKGSNYTSEINKFNQKINFINSRINDADRQFRTIYSVTGESSQLNFSGSSYKSSTAKVVSAVRKLNSKYIEAQRTIQDKGDKVADLQKTIKARDGRIDGLNELMKKKILEIKRLKKIINGDKDIDIVVDPWLDGSKDARLAVQGKIIKVDRKYGFVVVDIGSGTIVEQKIGTKVNKPNPVIPVNAQMIVARNIESPKGKYIGEIKIMKVNEDCSIANVLSTVKGQSVAVGDTVFFSEAQVDAITTTK